MCAFMRSERQLCASFWRTPTGTRSDPKISSFLTRARKKVWQVIPRVLWNNLIGEGARVMQKH
jgi:hypothetical protein